VPGFQIPFAEASAQEAGIKTMAVGLILTPQQADEALQAGSADLIAVGREAVYDPNWPLHAAQALGVDPDMARWPMQYGWWLTRPRGTAAETGSAVNEDYLHLSAGNAEAHRALSGISSRCRSRAAISRSRRATSSTRASSCR